jgi:hypothetical protein
MKQTTLEYAQSKAEIADIFNVSRESVHKMCQDGLVMPPKTRKGYNIAEFKARYDDYLDRKDGRKAGSAKETKLHLECIRLKVNIQIDNERLKQQEIETKKQQAGVVTIELHRQTMDDIRAMYLDGLNQIIENVATKARSVKVRDLLQSAVDGLRQRITDKAGNA